jgi:hypothetical protein
MNHRISALFPVLILNLWICGPALSDDAAISARFVELRNEDGNAILVVELTNSTSETMESLTFGCWTEDKSKIDSAEVTGSRFMAFNTGNVEWTGALKPGETTTASGIVSGMPGDMAARFSGQHFACSAS